MTYEIEYFAVFRERAGKDREQLQTDMTTPSRVYAQLSRQYGFDISQHRLKVAVNDQFAGWSDELRDGDRLVFIPPVAGG